MEEVKQLSLGYEPRPIQAFLHMTKRQKMIRFLVAVCHRRFGKTRYALAEIATSGFENPRHNPQYAYVAPTYGQAERIAWKYLKEMFREYPNVKPNEAKLRLEIPRPDKGDVITIWLLGAENPDSIRGIYLDGIVLDEYAQMNPAMWGEVVRPALSDRKGWAIFIGTPKGTNSFHKMYEVAKKNMATHPELGWYAFVAQASKTGIIPKEELAAMRLEMSEEEYEQEFECSFSAALVGSYYAKYIAKARKDGRIGNFPYNPAYPVTTYWDIGVDDMTTIWFVQKMGERYRVIDYYEASGVGLDHYAKILREKDYVYDDHWFPHDGQQREWGNNAETRVDTAKKLLGIRPRVGKKIGVADGINAVRVILGSCEFNEIPCMKGLNALEQYERTWDAKNDVFQDRPKHNWASHGADGFRLFANNANNRRVKVESLAKYRDAETDSRSIWR